MDLRERCEKVWFDAQEQYLRCGHPVRSATVIESFAREIRNEALEEATRAALSDHPDKYTNQNRDFCDGQAFAANMIDELKSIALAAKEKTE
jgi:hypothetical protein